MTTRSLQNGRFSQHVLVVARHPGTHRPQAERGQGGGGGAAAQLHRAQFNEQRHLLQHLDGTGLQHELAQAPGEFPELSEAVGAGALAGKGGQHRNAGEVVDPVRGVLTGRCAAET